MLAGLFVLPFSRNEGNKEFSQEEEFEIPSQMERPARTESETGQWLQSLLLFAVAWSFGGNLDAESRIKYVNITFSYID